MILPAGTDTYDAVQTAIEAYAREDIEDGVILTGWVVVAKCAMASRPGATLYTYVESESSVDETLGMSRMAVLRYERRINDSQHDGSDDEV